MMEIDNMEGDSGRRRDQLYQLRSQDVEYLHQGSIRKRRFLGEKMLQDYAQTKKSWSPGRIFLLHREDQHSMTISKYLEY